MSAQTTFLTMPRRMPMPVTMCSLREHWKAPCLKQRAEIMWPRACKGAIIFCKLVARYFSGEEYSKAVLELVSRLHSMLSELLRKKGHSGANYRLFQVRFCVNKRILIVDMASCSCLRTATMHGTIGAACGGLFGPESACLLLGIPIWPLRMPYLRST